MDTGRLRAMIPLLFNELSEISEELNKLIPVLKKAVAGQIVERAQLDGTLADAPSNTFVPSWIQMIHKLGGTGLYARPISRRVAAIIDEGYYGGEHTAILISGLMVEIDRFRGRLHELNTKMSQLSLEPQSIPDGKCEIGVIYPRTAVADLEDLTSELSELDRHLRVVAELAGTSGSLRLHCLATGSYEIFTLGDLITGGTLVTILTGLMAAWKQYEEARKLRKESAKLDEEIAEIIEKRASAKREAATRGLMEDILARSAANEARKNELRVQLQQTITFMETKIEMGVIFEVRGPSTVTSVDDASSASERDAAALIREAGHTMSELQARATQALLPENIRADNGSN